MTLPHAIPLPRGRRSRRATGALALAWLGCLACLAAGQAEAPFAFRDVSREVGLFPALKGIRAHAAILGDYNGDGWPDLFVGAFQTMGATPSALFRSLGGRRFEVDAGVPVVIRPGQISGGMLADLDNDGDLDLYLCNNVAGRGGTAGAPSYLYRNEGEGEFSDISVPSGACPPYNAFNVMPMDLDGDALIDIVLGGERYGQQGRDGGRLLVNLGKLRFQDMSADCGLPEGMGGAAAASADVNNDTYPDLYYTGPRGGLLLNNGRGRFTPAAAANAVLTGAAGQAPAGACFGDVDRDGWPDLVLGQNTPRPWVAPVAPRLLLNRGIRDGELRFEDVSRQAGLTPLPMRCPHIEIRDFDNDGWPDIYVGVFTFAGGQIRPVIYRNLGIRDGMVRFAESAMAAVHFPTAADRRLPGDEEAFFARMNRDRKITYVMAGPCGDYDRDGRIDILAVEWWPENPSFLLHNETPGGRWLQVTVNNAPGVNRMGLGARVSVYAPGRMGDDRALIGCQDIAIGCGSSSSQQAMAHFGLGTLAECDVDIVLPFGRGEIRRERVRTNRRLTVP